MAAAAIAGSGGASSGAVFPDHWDPSQKRCDFEFHGSGYQPAGPGPATDVHPSELSWAAAPCSARVCWRTALTSASSIEQIGQRAAMGHLLRRPIGRSRAD